MYQGLKYLDRTANTDRNKFDFDVMRGTNNQWASANRMKLDSYNTDLLWVGFGRCICTSDIIYRHKIII